MENQGKLIAINTFEGGQNSDIADELVPTNEARFFLNCLILSSAEGNVGIVTNLKGTELISTPLPQGENKCIGVCEDEENRKVYFAVWNSDGFHSWYMFSEAENYISLLIQLKTDTAGLSFWPWRKDRLILHIDVYEGEELYWVYQGDKPRKINIRKCLDKSDLGYGNPIIEQYTKAYKETSTFAPTVSYSTDTSIEYNMLFGVQFKFCTRFIYDDYERSNYSDFSNVAIPISETLAGSSSVSNRNNCLDVFIETGNGLVTDIEVCMCRTMPDGSISDWSLVAVLNKKTLNIGDDGNYTYRFYNDGGYNSVDQNKVFRPYSFLPMNPLCQSIVKNSIVYSNFEEGFMQVDPDISLSVDYADVYDESEYETVKNNPFMGYSAVTYWETDWGFNGWTHTVGTVRIGPDVKKGNVFKLWSPGSPTRPYFEYKANVEDDNVSVASYFINQLSRADRFKSVSNVSIDGSGNAVFTFDYLGKRNQHSQPFYTSAEAVFYSVLKDTGQNVKSLKLGSSFPFAIRYYDSDGRKSNAYSANETIIKLDTINKFKKHKLPIISFSINHRPPIWAKSWELLIGNDLTYARGQFIQIFIQKVVTYRGGNSGSQNDTYLDLIIGSLGTYQRLHPNTILKYSFQKGDRIRLIKELDLTGTSTDVYYDFYEAEILSYEEETIERVNDVAQAYRDDHTLRVNEPNPENIGLIIKVSDMERTISGVSGDGYILDKRMPYESTYPHYDIINRNGVLRIMKPKDITIKNGSIVELFTPSLKAVDDSLTTYYEFGHKYPIFNWGTNLRMHGSNFIRQSDVSPAVVKVSNGTVYIRPREMPTNNAKIPQVISTTIDDPNLSDFYHSSMNDLGRAVAKDDKGGVVKFIDRCRYSNNSIQGTKVKGFNDFDNLDRVDYNDNNGAIQRTVYSRGKLLVFKENNTGWTPIYGRVISDQEGNVQLGLYDKVLSPNLEYYAFSSGIGNHPEGYIRSENNHYFISTDSGSICRVGGDGIDAISEIYSLDKDVRTALSSASKNDAKIIMGYDRTNKVVLASIENHHEKIFQDYFIERVWDVADRDSSNVTVTDSRIISAPTNGTAYFEGENIVYNPNLNFIGLDTTVYELLIDGEWKRGELCVEVKDSLSQEFYNDRQEQVYYKQCTGSVGSAVTYVIDAGAYSSFISKQDANNKAVNDLLANGQAYANQNGTCEWVNEARSRVFLSSVCPINTRPADYTYSVVQGKYSSTVSLDDANRLADDEITANGQLAADANGVCVLQKKVMFGFGVAKGTTADVLTMEAEMDLFGSVVELDMTTQAQGKYLIVRDIEHSPIRKKWSIVGGNMSGVLPDEFWEEADVSVDGYVYYISKVPLGDELLTEPLILKLEA